MGTQGKHDRPLTLMNLRSADFNAEREKGAGGGGLIHKYVERKCAKWHSYGEPNTPLTHTLFHHRSICFLP